MITRHHATTYNVEHVTVRSPNGETVDLSDCTLAMNVFEDVDDDICATPAVIRSGKRTLTVDLVVNDEQFAMLTGMNSPRTGMTLPMRTPESYATPVGERAQCAMCARPIARESRMHPWLTIGDADVECDNGAIAFTREDDFHVPVFRESDEEGEVEVDVGFSLDDYTAALNRIELAWIERS